MVLDRRPAAISLTGSNAVGWSILAKVGRKHLVLELGGNAAVVIDRSADLDAALRAEERLTVGAVIVNDVPTFRVDTMPYGGERESGLDREGVRDAVAAFTTP